MLNTGHPNRELVADRDGRSDVVRHGRPEVARDGEGPRLVKPPEHREERSGVGHVINLTGGQAPSVDRCSAVTE